MEPTIGIPQRIARLFLLSDILYNSGYAEIKNAWKFRYEIQKILPDLFRFLRQVFVDITGRITAETMKEKVLQVLRAWNQWSIYPKDLLSQLENTFLGQTQLPSIQTSSQPQPQESFPDDYYDPSWDIDGEPLF
jgi:U2-associated protein SR140